jgi:rhodanese-related sulfurtransferase
MPVSIARDDVRRLVAEGAQLVEVLPEHEYLDEHLPGAVHLPLKTLTASAASRLDKTRPVVVYCWDALCDMSPRAARHMERFGFHPVYDYTTGKADWIAAGLPTEGQGQHPARVTEGMDRDLPTCRVDDSVADAANRARAKGSDIVVVVDHDRTILGRVRLSSVDDHADSTAGEVMEPGPTTVHGGADLDETLDRLEARRVPSVLVSTPDGELLGVLRVARQSPT